MYDTILITGLYDDLSFGFISEIQGKFIQELINSITRFMNYRGQRINSENVFLRKGPSSENKVGKFFASKISPSAIEFCNNTEIVLKTVLKNNGLTYKYIDLNLLASSNNLKNIITERTLTFSLSTTFIGSKEFLRSTLKKLRECDNNAKIILGGPFITTNWQFIYEMEEIDCIVIGEGDETFPLIIKAIKEGRQLDDIKGIIYRDPGKGIVKTEDTPYLDLNLLATPDWSLIEKDKETKIIRYETGRGCISKCKFCNEHTTRKKLSLKNIDKIIKDWKCFISQYGVEHIIITDSNFTFSPKRVQEFAKSIIKENMKVGWASFARVNDLQDENTVALIKESGCRMLLIGLESGDERMLKIMNKKATLDQAKRAIELTKKYNIVSMCFFLIGFPGETLESFENTKKFISQCPPDTIFPQVFRITQKNLPILNPADIESFGIELENRGEGIYWKHNTMDMDQASEILKDLVFFIVNKSDSVLFDGFNVNLDLYYTSNSEFDPYFFIKAQKEFQKAVIGSMCSNNSSDKLRDDAWDKLFKIYLTYLQETTTK